MSVEEIAGLFEAHRSPVIGLYEDGRCAFVNPALRTLLGEDADATPDPAAFLSAPDSDAGILPWTAAEDTGSGGQYRPVLIRRADGEQFPAGARGAWVFATDGTRLFIITLAVQTDSDDGEFANPLLHAINEAVIIADRDRRILYANDAACRRYGYRPKEFAGLTLDAIVSPASERTPAKIHDVLFEKRADFFENEHVTRSGHVIPVEVSTRAITYHGVPAIMSVSRDITSRREEERQQLLDEIFLSAHDGFILLDDRQRVQIWNKAAERITGYAGDEMAGTILAESPIFGEQLREILVPEGDAGDNHRSRAELHILTRKGEERACEMTVSVVRRVRGTNTLCILRDVSRQKAILDALTRNEEYLRLVIDSADLGTWDWRVDSGMVAISPDMYDILGLPYNAEWVPFSAISAQMHPDDRDRWERSMETYAKGRPVREKTEFRMHAPDGRWVWFASDGSAAEFNDDGTARRVVGILRDITEEKQAEQALREANKKLSVLSGITRHDILNQIQGLLFFSEEIIHGEYSPEEQRMMAEKILAASETINRQINFTRTYENLGAEPAEWQNLTAMVEEAKGVLPPGLICTVHLPQIEVYADRLFVEVLKALCDNIRAHAEGAANGAVSFEERGGSGILVIADDGCGIPASKKEKIFMHNPAKPGKSLFLAQEIAGVTGVRITETGTEGKGAVFEVAFPKTGYRFVPQK